MPQGEWKAGHKEGTWRMTYGYGNGNTYKALIYIW